MKNKIKISRFAANSVALFFFGLTIGLISMIWSVPFFMGEIIKTMLVLASAVLGVVILWDLVKLAKDNPSELYYNKKNSYGPLSFLYSEKEDNAEKKVKSYGWKFALFVSAVLIAFVFFTVSLFSAMQCKFIYNKSVILHNEYVKVQQERIGFYDKMWKTYLQKEDITTVNKETFVEISKIIMENRRDGMNTSWKWVHENQQIPFEEFSKFYNDLSKFIEEQRSQYFEIEKRCQIIAMQNNTLLDTFPNNILNRYITKCNRINYEYGFTSDSTNAVFKNKVENIF